MRTVILSILYFITIVSVKGQTPNLQQDSILSFYNEIKAATGNYITLWNKNLYGPVIFVHPQTREFFTNEPGMDGTLQSDKNIYSGILPASINIANTALNRNDKRWAMIMLPLPQNKENRINLLAHELFHSAQPELGFTLNNADNNHLDQKDGRIYLRLELEALKKAIQANAEKELHQHLTHALIFRQYRHTIYARADSTENQLELNEGIAEFTGLIVSSRNKTQTTDHVVKGINDFFNNPTFVRSFAYYTAPVYGYLLYNKNKDWHKSITSTTNLTHTFIEAFNVKLPADLKKTVEKIKDQYNGKTIVREELEREEKMQQLIAAYKLKFVEQPHFEIRFQKMNVSFNPSNIMPLEDKGTVYPNMRITDVWGILTVENGALMSPNWDKLSISNPTQITDEKVFGDGWVLELAEGYTVKKDAASNNYQLVKAAMN